MFLLIIRYASFTFALLLTIELIRRGDFVTGAGALLSFCSIIFAATFGEQIVGLLKPRYPKAPDIPINPETGFAYLQGNARLLDATKAVAERRHLTFVRALAGNDYMAKRFTELKGKTVRDVDNYVKKYGVLASRVSDYWHPEKPELGPDHFLGYVLDVSLLKEHGAKEFLRHQSAVSGRDESWYVNETIKYVGQIEGEKPP